MKTKDILNENPKGASNLFHMMNKRFDYLESFSDSLEKGALNRLMEEENLTGERKAMLKKVNELINEFGDFMPGLEMQFRGDE